MRTPQESNLLSGFSVRTPEEIAVNRSRDDGALLLSGLTPDFMAADLFAAAAVNPSPTRTQLWMLHRYLRPPARKFPEG